MSLRARITVVAVLAVGLGGILGAARVGAAPACEITWDGSASTSWHMAANWDLDRVPAAGDVVCVPAGFTVNHTTGTTTIQTLLSDGSLVQSGGALNVTGTGADESDVADYTLAAGSLSGTGTLAVTGGMSWTGGSMKDAGVTRVAAGATLVRELENTVFLENGRVIENAGTLDVRSDRFLSVAGAAPLIHNTGTIVKTAGAGTATIIAAVDNDGVVRSSSGTLELRGGSGSGAGSGDWGAPAASGTVTLTGSTFALADGAALLGTVTVAGATVSVPAAATATASGVNTLVSGAIAGTGELTVTGTLSWTGGSMKDAGTTRVAAGATLVRELANTVFLESGRVIENAGTLDVRSDHFTSISGSPAPLIHNTGTIVKTAGAGTATILAAVDNDGTVRSSSGTLALRGGGGPGNGDWGAPAAAGTVTLTGGTFTLGDGAALLGKVTIAGATVDVADGATATASGVNTLVSGAIAGTGELTVTGTLSWTGGSMKDAGTTRVAAAATLVRELANTVFLESGRVIENAGTLDVRSDHFTSVSGSPASLIHNTGTIVKSAGAGTATIIPAVDNDGVVRSSSGTLALRGGGGPGSGDWGAPAAAGTVSLAGGTFTLAGGAALLGKVTIAGATVDVADAATATASGANTLAGGSLGGTGTLDVGGVLTLAGGNMEDQGTTRVLGTGRLEVPSTGAFFVEDGRLIENSGQIRFLGDRGLPSFGSPTPRIHNAASGTVRKTAGSGTATVSVPLANDGVVESLAGRLRLDTDLATVTHTGVFRGASESALPVFGFGTHVLAAGADLEGWTGIDAGSVEVAAGVTLPVDDQLLLSGGELTGPGAVSITGRLRWTGGAQAGPGTTTVAPGGRIDAVDPAGCDVDLSDGRRLDNRGTISIGAGTAIFAFGSVPPVLDNGGRLEIAGSDAGGCAGVHGISGNARVNNLATGTIEKLGGGGRATIEDVLDNDGQVLAGQGELALSSASGVAQTGAFGGAGGTVAFADGDFELAPGATISGSVAIEQADLSLPEDLLLTVAAGDALRMTGGSIVGGELRIEGAFDWVDGTRGGPGTTTVEPGATLNLGSADPAVFGEPRLDDGHSFVNRGSAELLGPTLEIGDDASIVNEGTLLLGRAGEVTGDDFGTGFGFGSLLHNTGTLRKTGTGVMALNLPLDNDGTLEVAAGALELGRLLNWSDDFAGDDGSLTGGAYVVRGRLRLPGPLRANAARVVLDGPASSLVYSGGFEEPDVDATDRLARNTAGGTLEVIGGRVLTLPEALLNAGLLRIGPASKVVTPAYRQGANAVLRPVLKSTTEFGELETPGTATLDGRIDAERDAAFAPADGQEFSVVRAGAVAGTFAELSGGALGGGLELEARYEPPGVKLRVRPVSGLQARPAPDRAQTPIAAPDAPGAALSRVRFDDRALTVRAGRWKHVRSGRTTLSVATERGATLVRRGVTARKLAVLARTCRRCGSVQVWFRGRLLARISLRSRRPARRLLPVAAFATTRAGTVRLRTVSSHRVAIDALVVDR